MDLCIILLPVHGKKFVFAFIGHLTQYFHTLTISIQCIAPQEGKLLFELHGQFWAKLYDGDNHILCGLGKVFHYSSMYAQLIHQANYYSLVDVMTYTTSHLSRNNLPYYFLKQQLGKMRRDHLGNCSYLSALYETFSIFLIWMPYDDHVLFIIYGMVWAS